MQKGVTFSLLLHLLILLLLYFGLPSIFDRDIPNERIITVDLLPISSETNVKTEQKVEPKEKEEKKEKTNKEEKKVEPEKQEKEKVNLKKEKAEKIPEKKPEKKKEKKSNDFESVLKTVEKINKSNKDPLAEIEKSLEEFKPKTNQASTFDPTKPLSVSERDAVMQQIARCWIVPAGARDAQSMLVRIKVLLKEDGTVVSANIMDKGKYETSDGFYRAAVDSAVRAVLKCSPIKNLPREKYSSWKEMELTFDPKEMIY